MNFNSFSIVIPTYNGLNHIGECIKSCAVQNYNNFNIIIVDSFSNDGTVEFIKNLGCDKIQIQEANRRFFIEENWNRIKDIETNEFVTILGQDDLLKPNYLSTMNLLINENPNISLYQSQFDFVDSSSKLIKNAQHIQYYMNVNCLLKKILLKQIDINATGYVFRKKDFILVGGIPTIYPNLLFADFELWIQLTKIKGLITSTENCFSFRLHQSTTSTSSDLKMLNSFEIFISYLNRIKSGNTIFEQTILSNASFFLVFYCKSFSHRLLRSKIKDRQNLYVKDLIVKFKEFARQLDIEAEFKPDEQKSIMLAKFIDSNYFTRNLFLLFKSIFNRPFLK